jgi:hypothetical protein
MFLGVISGAQLFVDLLAPPAVAQRDGHGALGVVLADDVAVEFGDDLLRGHADMADYLWLGKSEFQQACQSSPGGERSYQFDGSERVRSERSMVWCMLV